MSIYQNHEIPNSNNCDSDRAKGIQGNPYYMTDRTQITCNTMLGKRLCGS